MMWGSARFRRARMLGAALAALLVLSLVPLAAAPASAEGSSQLSLTKTASTATVNPGDTFSYSLEVGCTAIDVGTGCTNATLVDVVPGQFEVIGATVGTGLSAETPDISGNTVTVVFNSPLVDPPGAIGLLASATGVVTITVRVRTDLPFEQNGVPIDNTGTLTATNQLAPATSTATVTPTVPLDLATTATKSFSPTGAPAAPGATTTLTIGGTNTSNAGVDSIVLTDPTDPAASPNPFDLLEVTGLGAVTFPAGADQVQVDVWDGTQWVLGAPGATAVLPPGVATTDIHGVRVTFTNAAGDPIPAGSTGSVAIDLQQRPEVVDLTAETVVANEVQSEVALDGQSQTGTADSTYTIQSSIVTVGATKTFSPATVVAGDPTTVTIGGSNQSAVPLTELTLTEPSLVTADPFADGFPTGVTFDGFSSGVVWPAGATGASVHYYYADGTDEVLTAAGRDTLPPPDPAKTVVRFSVTFTGDIPPGQSATIPFSVSTDPGITNDVITVPNSQTVSGTSAEGTTGSADAAADLTVYTTRLSTTIGKTISPNEITSAPGEFVTVQLPASTGPFPQSTTDANTIVVQDPPGDPPAETDWWNHFNATAITQTAVPAGSTMTIEYWDGTQWVELPGAVDIAGPTIFTLPIDPALQDSIHGLRFTFTSVDGFPPGTTVQPNVTMSLRDQLRDGTGPATGTDETIENCASASAANPSDSASATVPSPCPVVTTDAGGLPGAANFLDKTWVGSKVVTARTESEVPVQLNWSTGGRANLSQMVISDSADPATTAVSDSVYNAFDLVDVPAISAAQDPFLKYDQITSVQLYNGTAWVDATDDPCPAACVGTFPGVTLTAAEQASTIGVRLTYVESPARAAASAGDPTAPPVGSGVARSTGNTRQLALTFRLRDDVRAPVTTPDPVIGTRLYNTGVAGEVNNTARATGTSALDGSTVTDTASDIIRLLDVPLNVNVAKTWTGGPIGIPPAGTDPSLYPLENVDIQATNATAASVDQLELSDPAIPGSLEPFNTFNLSKITVIAQPPGATGTTVLLTRTDGVTTGYTRAEAFALTEAELADVTLIQVVHTGRIVAGAQAIVSFDTRLRATHRFDGTPVTAADSPVPNVAQAAVSDDGGAPGGTPTATSTATMALEEGTLTVSAGKSFDPASQTEPDDSPITMTLTGQPGGSIRTTKLTLTDDTGTFWNAYDFVDFAEPLTFTAPINQVQVDACIGRSFSDPTLGCEADGGHWVLGAVQNAADGAADPLPAGVAPADVEGIRYTFSRDGDFFEGPTDPLQVVKVSVQRRTDLRSGGAVPSDLAGNAPAPGETVAGTFTNSVTADVVGAFEIGGAPFTATDSETAVEKYVHATTGVSVQKTPAGVEQPGAIIPYTLTVTNTGAIAITDPVITDRIPSDASGPLLMFDPFADPAGPGPYTYTLTGAAPTPPSGPAMPTSTSDVTATVSQAGGQIQFTFPPGTVLEVGQTYTITVALMFRTGLPAGTNVTNELAVTGDRPFDTCDGALDPVSGECRADTTVTVETAGALRGVKSVRATDTQLGVDQTSPTVQCAADPDGFYSGPCVPITKPGGTEVWRLALINTGTLPMDRMVAIDKLPVPGDTGAITPLPRGSEWRPTFTGDVDLASGPGDAQLTTYYTTGDVCTDDLSTTGVACPTGAWTELTPGTDTAAVTGLKFVVAFPTPITPGGRIDIDVTTRTPASSPALDPDSVAWNTVAVAGRVEIAGVPTVTTPTEGNKVGVELATGPLSLVKVVTGAGAGFAPGSFDGTLLCVSAGEALDPIPVTIVPGTPTTVENLPWGADCTVDEADAGQSGSSSTHAIVGLPSEPVGVITVTNRYDLAGLVVTKNIDSAAVDQNGDPIAYGPFPVDVDCTFLGSPVFATGYSAVNPMAADLAAGESLTLTGLPAGSSCTVTETDTKGATTTTVTTVTATGSTGPTTGTTGTVELTPNAVGRPTNAVTIVNSYDVGSLHLVKAVDGPGAADFGAGPFRLQVTCTLTDPSGTRTTWNGLVTLGGGRPLETTIENIASGSVCDVTEPFAGGANSSVVTPGEVSIDSGQTATVTATNTFLAGAIHVTKVRKGPGVALYGAGPFEVTLSCLQLVNGVPSAVDIPGGATRTLDAAGGYEADYLLLPAGATCVLRETGTGGATGVAIADAAGEPSTATRVVPGETIELTDTNTFDVGSITVTKSVEGGGAATRGTGDFVVHLACALAIDGMPVPIVIPGGADRTLSTATTLVATYDQLPTGAACQVTETSDGGADTTTITPNAGDSLVGTATVGDGTSVAISVVNEFDPAPPSTSQGGLSDTGSDVWPLLLGGFGALALGALLLRRRRA